MLKEFIDILESFIKEKTLIELGYEFRFPVEYGEVIRVRTEG